MLNGKRQRLWPEACADSSEVALADWPIKGPRTTSWCLQWLNQQPGGPIEHHHLWRRTGNLTTSDFGVTEHEIIMESLKFAVTVDQLNVCNSAAFETLLRRAQTIEYAHQEKMRDVPTNKGGQGGGKNLGSGATLTVEEQEAFAGASRPGVSMVCPRLLDHVKEDIARTSELMKSMLKAREWREAMSKHK